jgi:hypothetical protein
MNAFMREEGAAGLIRHLAGVVGSCPRQRQGLTLERERTRLGRELRHAEARLQLRRGFREEVEAVSGPPVESAHAG